MRKGLLLVCGLLLASCGSEGAVKDAVKDGLIDPESARFGEISFSESGKLACVSVNAKNRMGGYTGESQMVVGQLSGSKWVVVQDYDSTTKAASS